MCELSAFCKHPIDIFHNIPVQGKCLGDGGKELRMMCCEVSFAFMKNRV